MSREMKDSGVEWIGEIPADWDICKIDSLYFPRSTKVSDKDYPPLSVTMKGIVPQLATTAKTDDHDNRKLVKKGDFAINSRSDRRGSCGISEYDGSVSLINTVLQPRHGMNNEYYNWLFHSDMFSSEFYRLGHGIVDDLRTTSWQEMKKMVIPAPSPTEQQQIVHFLDRKCTAIDTAIEKTKKSIEKLEEYKKAVITKAVTKGLDPDAMMKDSGVEWIGEVPETWDTLRIKHSSWLKGRIGWDGLKSEEFIDDGPYLITGTDFNDGIVNWDTCVHITEDRYNEDKLLHVYNGDLLITKDGTVGKLAIITNAPDKVSLNSGVMIIRNNSKFKYDQQYMFYVLKSDVFTKWFDHHKKPGSTIQHLYQHQFDDFRYPFPSLAEQKNIAAYLEEKCMAIDALIVKKQEAISKLEEYKKSLIYYAVTGKIDCRNEAV